MLFDSLFSQINIDGFVSVSSLTVHGCPYSAVELDLKDEIRYEFGEFIDIEVLFDKRAEELCWGVSDRVEILDGLLECAENQLEARGRNTVSAQDCHSGMRSCGYSYER